MSITIDTEPSGAVPARNPVILEVTTDAFITTPCTKTEAELEIDADADQDDSLRIQWGSNDFTYTFKASPSGNLQILRTYSGDRIDWIRDVLLHELQKNATLLADFDVWLDEISSSEGHLHFEAKECGTSNINLTWTDFVA